MDGGTEGQQRAHRVFIHCIRILYSFDMYILIYIYIYLYIYTFLARKRVQHFWKHPLEQPPKSFFSTRTPTRQALLGEKNTQSNVTERQQYMRKKTNHLMERKRSLFFCPPGLLRIMPYIYRHSDSDPCHTYIDIVIVTYRY